HAAEHRGRQALSTRKSVLLPGGADRPDLSDRVSLHATGSPFARNRAWRLRAAFSTPAPALASLEDESDKTGTIPRAVVQISELSLVRILSCILSRATRMVS